MRIAGLPVWALVLVACAVAPFVVQLWIDAEQRRARERTRALLRPFTRIAPGTQRAASMEQRPLHEADESDEHRDDD